MIYHILSYLNNDQILLIKFIICPNYCICSNKLLSSAEYQSHFIISVHVKEYKYKKLFYSQRDSKIFLNFIISCLHSHYLIENIYIYADIYKNLEIFKRFFEI